MAAHFGSLFFRYLIRASTVMRNVFGVLSVPTTSIYDLDRSGQLANERAKLGSELFLPRGILMVGGEAPFSGSDVSVL